MKHNLYRLARIIFRLFNAILKRFGFILSKPDFIHGSPAFSGALVLSRRAFQTKELFIELDNVEGDIVEGGVHWGYGLLIELLLNNKHIHAFDSFSGHSKPHSNDKSSADWKPLDSSFAVSKEDVLKTLRYGTSLKEADILERVTFYDGWVQDTMPGWSKKMEEQKRKVAYVHADMDIYEPIKVILTQTFPHLSRGAIVNIGMLNNPELKGKTVAFNEFLDEIEDGSIEIKTHPVVDTDGREVQQTYFVKL